MQINKSERFFDNLYAILDFISQDSFDRAVAFKESLDDKIHSLPDNPCRCRKSIHFDDENIRDLVFMGYVIPYIINKEQDEIALLGIVKHNLW